MTQMRVKGLPRQITMIFSGLGIMLAVNQLFALKLAGFMPMANAYYYYLLTCFLSMVYLIFPGRTKDHECVPWFDWLLFAASLISTIYLGLNSYNIVIKGWESNAPFLPTLAGLILWVLALEAVRRAGGTSLCLICLGFSLYPLFAGHMPGILWGNSFTFLEMVRYHSMGVESIIGITTRVVGNLLIGFIIFGVALVAVGGGKFFMDLATALLGHKRGGAAKVSVLSSAFMASLSGSVLANVVTTGSVTIPAMKRTGYSPTYAAAIEACASTGGSIMPPIMGAAGFLIASFLNIPYANVMLAAFFPAFLYYLTLLIQVDCHAARVGLGGLDKSKVPDLMTSLKEGWFVIGALIILIVILLVMRSEALAPFYTMLFLFACSMIRKQTRFTWKKFTEFLIETGNLVSQITAVLAGVGLILGALSGTGAANAFSRELVVAAGENYILLLFFGAITSFILGIGMTVTACYVFLGISLGPALVKTGLDPLASHLFILYWGVMSYITPPVATGAIGAAALAGSNAMRTGFLAMRLGLAKYIVPFFFVLDPSMILRGTVYEVLLTTLTGIIGSILLGTALEGYLYRYGEMSFPIRIPVFVSGILFLYPSLISDLIAFIIITVFIVFMSWVNVQSIKKAS